MLCSQSTVRIDQLSGSIRHVDFSNTDACAGCNPLACKVGGESIPVGNWRDLLITLIEHFLMNNAKEVNELHSKSLWPGSSRPFLLKEKPSGASRQISNGCWVYINYNIPALVDLIGKLCHHCGVSLDAVEITYTPKAHVRFGDRSVIQNGNGKSSVFAQPNVRSAFREWLQLQHPDWSPGTVMVHLSDAYYLHNNDRGLSIDEALTIDNGIEQAYNAILHHFVLNPTKTNNPALKASGYRRSLQLLKNFLAEEYPELLSANSFSYPTVPESVFDVLREDYANGFRFDTTALRLLSDKAGIEVDGLLQPTLKREMFRRNDNVFFLLDIVTDEKARKEIIDFADALLDEYGCFEISELYSLYTDILNPRCIGDADDFETFYEFVNDRDVRCVAVPHMGTRVARCRSGNLRDLFKGVAKKITAVTRDEFGGTICEDDLCSRFCAFSADLLGDIIKNFAEQLVRTEINGIVVYQTLDALGLTDEFSDVLRETLDRIDDLGLSPSEEVLHTALSFAMGVNFKVEFSIPDQATYRRLVAAYYKAEPPREWKGGIFSEVSS